MADPILVVAAVRRMHGLYWICRRAANGEHAGIAGMWEYPGGKVEPGEQPEDALIREMREEFDVHVFVGQKLDDITTETEGQLYRVLFYHVYFLSDPEKLYAHDEARWCAPFELTQYTHLPSGTEFNRRLLAAR